MHDDIDLSGQLKDLGNDEIEIEFVDVDESLSEPEPEPEWATASESPCEAGLEVSDESAAAKIDSLQAELAHVRDVYLRKLAEFDNFRKRVERERDDLRQSALEDFVRELLPIVDNIDRALQHAGDDSGAFHQGVEMIAKQLHDTLERKGIKEIDPLGQPFDPEVHEAVQRVEGRDEPPGTVVFVMLKGYTRGDRLIRPALVGVAVEPETLEGEAGGES